MDDADFSLALKSCVFAAVGTAGQRCTSMRRLFLHEAIYDKFVSSMVAAYKTVKIGNPLETGTLIGPLHSKRSVKQFEDGIKNI